MWPYFYLRNHVRLLAGNQTCNEADRGENQENDEQALPDFHGYAGKAGCTENDGDQGKDEECDGCSQHKTPPVRKSRHSISHEAARASMPAIDFLSFRR